MGRFSSTATGARRRAWPDRTRLALQFVGRKIRQHTTSMMSYRCGWANFMILPVIVTGIVLEGGSIEVNGEGSLLTTESCLLNRIVIRVDAREIEEYLHLYLGVSKIIWLGDGIAGDDTMVMSMTSRVSSVLIRLSP